MFFAVPLAAQARRVVSAFTSASTGCRLGMLGLAVALASCGGGGGGGSADTGTSSSAPPTQQLQSSTTLPIGDEDVRRFLIQATFGPGDADIARVKAVGYEAWIDEQFDRAESYSHLGAVKTLAQARNDGRDPIPDMLVQSWWTTAIAAPNQLRHRVAFALSEIFVVSTVTVDTRMAASYLDMLVRKSDATYRDLLESVALHPTMGFYLSHMSNRKEDIPTGRVPDENFAREVMQLFSIGLYELDDSARPIMQDNRLVESYSSDDIKGLAKVFTGWAWYRKPSLLSLPWWRCFFRATDCQFDEQLSTNMSAYDSEHSASAKSFLGLTIPAQATPNPQASLKTALDRLASHRNTAPFISKQLIQKLVTSNPSPRYVADVTGVFRASQGNLRAVVKAILLHDEARKPQSTGIDMDNYGKVREPLLRLSHLMRALPHSSLNNASAHIYMAEDTSDPARQLGQTPMRSPSVFNFFRPGYTPPQTSLADASLVAPEMQMSTETTVLGYANFVADILHFGWGYWNAAAQRPDIRFELDTWYGIAGNSATLIDAIAQRLLGRKLSPAEATTARNAIDTMPSSTTQDKRLRVQAAILMVAVSPSFIVQQ